MWSSSVSCSGPGNVHQRTADFIPSASTASIDLARDANLDNPTGFVAEVCLGTYASKHGGDELFAPAFVLQSLAPERPATADLLATLSPDAQTLLQHLRTLRA